MAACIFVRDAAPVADRYQRGTVVAVVGTVSPKDPVPPGVQPGHPDHIPDPIRTPVGEEHPVEPRCRLVNDGSRGHAAGEMV